jgi:hypothetical protein
MDPATLHAFTLRMAGHGFSVSGTLMNHDLRYALEQLRCAHSMAVESLRRMAVELFGQVEPGPAVANAAARGRAPVPLR